MKEPVEDKLIHKIREVFDEYEDNSAEFGWNELRKNHPKQKKLFIWLSSAAAILIILSGFWLFTGIEPSQKFTYKKVKQNNSQTQSQLPEKEVRKPKLITDSVEYIVNQPAKSAPQFSISQHSQKSLVQTIDLKEKDKQIQDQTNKPLLVNTISKQQPSLTVQKQQETNPLMEETIQLDSEKEELTVLNEKEPSSFKEAIQPGMEKEITIKKSPKLVSKLVEKESKKEVLSKDKKFTFSVYAGTYMNYAKGSESIINLGAGLTSDIALSKNLKLSTGLAIAKNSLEFPSTKLIPQAANASFNYDRADALTLNSASYNSISSSKLNNLNADFLILDIPINIKYQVVATKKNNFYILTGLSSGTYLSEAYTYNYEEYSAVNNQFSVNSRSKNTSQSFNNFDFAKTLNISMGFSSDINNTQNFTVEPFLKYPLEGLGSKNIPYGSAGINLKLNFKTSKK